MSHEGVLLGRLADFIELTKPRIAVLALATVVFGFTLGSAGVWSTSNCMHALIGIGLVAAASSALNQFFERAVDAKMPRTVNRPLPSGRISGKEALAFGVGAAAFGLLYLAMFTNATTVVLAASTLVLYAFVYTPLKRVTALCTAVGAIPGALPPVLGWTAAGGSLDAAAFSLFALMFVWQFPHFTAIAWLYRQQYADAGLKMLPAGASSQFAGFVAVAYALVMIPVSLLPAEWALAGNGYLLAALILGLAYLASSIRFMIRQSVETAQGLLWTSLIYLPVLLFALVWDHWTLLQ
ncbi:MAG: protoheme IX farnesyltransferase [Planctomycetaceae bacterium]|nr:protoheme IX farnesyltransferase [Planctomycetaceae bacterium]